MRPWGIHKLEDMVASWGCEIQSPDKKRWFRAVPEPYRGDVFQRLRAAWWVFTGKAEAVEWPKPGDLENAIARGKWE